MNRLQHVCLVVGVASMLSLIRSSAIARVGETLAECEVRYGTAQKGGEVPDLFGATSYVFMKSGMKIVAAILDGSAVSMAFLQLETDAAGKPLPLSELQIQTLLDANDAGGAWLPQREGHWVSRDGSLVATYDDRGRMLTLVNIGVLQQWEKNKGRRESVNLEDF
jgi:hypothetical protein